MDRPLARLPWPAADGCEPPAGRDDELPVTIAVFISVSSTLPSTGSPRQFVAQRSATAEHSLAHASSEQSLLQSRPESLQSSTQLAIATAEEAFLRGASEAQAHIQTRPTTRTARDIMGPKSIKRCATRATASRDLGGKKAVYFRGSIRRRPGVCERPRPTRGAIVCAVSRQAQLTAASAAASCAGAAETLSDRDACVYGTIVANVAVSDP
jgi:hypothetical protein